MDFSAVGALAFTIAIISLFNGPRPLILMMIVFNLLGASYAVSVGSIFIGPSYLFILPVLFSLLLQMEDSSRLSTVVSYPKPAFWLLCLVLFSLISAYFFPRLLSGVTEVNAIGSTGFEPSLLPAPLVPSSGNLSQSIYVVCSALTFILIYSFCSSLNRLEWAIKCLYFYASLNVIFAFIDLVTFYLGLGWTLGFIRNGSYTLHVDEEIGGLKRIVGSFTETSSFSGVTLSNLAFTASMIKYGPYRALSIILTFVQCILLIISTSSTAYIGLIFFFMLLLMTIVKKMATARFRLHDLNGLMLFLLLLTVIFSIFVFSENAQYTADGLIQKTLVDKSVSDSGVERQAWNIQAIKNFYDTYGIGVGLGSARASSFALAVLSNIGIIGSILYLAFTLSIFCKSNANLHPLRSVAFSSTRLSAIFIIWPATISGTMVDLGLQFFVLMAVCAASQE